MTILVDLQTVMHQVKQNSLSMYELFPEMDHRAILSKTTSELLQQYGAQYNAYVLAEITCNQIREACSQILTQYSSQIPQIVLVHLTAYQLGVREFCGELSTRCAIELVNRQKHAILVLAQNPNHTDSKPCSHAFVVVNPTQEINKKDYKNVKKIDELLQRFRNGYVIDPYLNTIFQGNQYSSSLLHTYIQESGISKIAQIIHFDPQNSQADSVHSLTQTIASVAEEAQAILNQRGAVPIFRLCISKLNAAREKQLNDF